MKRTIAITLAVAMIGGLMFMGFAGTAAAQVNEPVDDGINIETGDAVNIAEVNQGNFNQQVGTATADATTVSDKNYKSSTSASASVSQSQDVGQSNTAIVDQDANTGISIGDIDIGIGDPVNNQT
ncbi:hypothetical protein [Natronobeatus ordinarius]|uniref:hypothetical protein n=1 Tax=Natronobeatus ordinarius TaxID=2963433 RepID=UPI0020CEA78B|nr:hypothetical protein [Natronobeatus ordinarius]